MLKHNSILPLKNEASLSDFSIFIKFILRIGKRLVTFCDKTIKIGIMILAVAALDAIWVKTDAITHTTTKRAGSGISKFAN